jgi:AcrR family transcriptional regulator
MAGRRAEARRRNAEALSQAADRLFTEHGYQAVGIEAIAEEAGLTTGAIYSIFGAKHALLLAVLNSRLDRVAEATRELEADQHLTAEEAVAAFARAYCRLVASLDGRRALRLEVETLALALQDDQRGGELFDCIDQTRRHLVRLLVGRQAGPTARHRLTPDEAAILADAEAALIHGLAQQAAIRSQPPDANRWARAAAALVALTGPGPVTDVSTT